MTTPWKIYLWTIAAVGLTSAAQWDLKDTNGNHEIDASPGAQSSGPGSGIQNRATHGPSGAQGGLTRVQLTQTGLQQPLPLYPIHIEPVSDRRSVGTQTDDMVITFPKSISPKQGPFDQAKSYEHFSAKLFQTIAPRYSHTNIVYSPISVQTLLGYIYMGADGNTADELYNTLELANTPTDVADGFQKLLDSQRVTTGAQLVMANKMYYSNDLTVKSRTQYDVFFKSTHESINFKKPNKARQKINTWVRDVTNNRITQLVAAKDLSQDTRAVLLNAIYFKANWTTPFSRSDTTQQPFHITNTEKAIVDMMYLEDSFRCADLPDLHAKALELPYENTDMSMLLILPNEIDGLLELERRLAGNSLSAISARLRMEKTVTIALPTFKVDFALNLVDQLKELGIHQLFSNEADLSNFFENNGKPLGVSRVQHRATINVNEAGSEAAAASFSVLIPLSLPAKQFIFTADHPFLFAIRGPNAVFFIGHVVRPEPGY